ncbi:MAG: hypothetical protein HYV27_06260 [Candidatus Hydrogenedentes bacterium]|nr:hypothetical protein [Candidatus Hydrogenedentota bacterium]
MADALKDKLDKLTRLCAAFAVGDYDFLVRFLPCTPSEHAAGYFGLLEAFQDLLGAQVDLVEIGAIRNPFFKVEVDSNRILDMRRDGGLSLPNVA